MMTEVAGEVARRRSSATASRPSATSARSRSPRSSAAARRRASTLDDFEISGPMFVVTGTNDEEMAAAASGTRQQIAFYGSTPAYRAVLELHGWGDLQTELNRLSKQGEWVTMGDLIDDEILDTFAVVGEPEQIAPELHKRVRRCRRPDLVLRAVPQRSRSVARGARGAQGRLAKGLTDRLSRVLIYRMSTESRERRPLQPAALAHPPGPRPRRAPRLRPDRRRRRAQRRLDQARPRHPLRHDQAVAGRRADRGGRGAP